MFADMHEFRSNSKSRNCMFPIVTDILYILHNFTKVIVCVITSFDRYLITFFMHRIKMELIMAKERKIHMNKIC